MDAQSFSIWVENNIFFLALSVSLITCLSFALGILCQSGNKRTLRVHITSEIADQNKRTNQIYISRTGEEKTFSDTLHLIKRSSDDGSTSFKLGKKWIVFLIGFCVLLVFVMMASTVRSRNVEQISSGPVQIEIDETPKSPPPEVDETPESLPPEVDETPESLPPEDDENSESLPPEDDENSESLNESPELEPKSERKIFSGNFRWLMKPIQFDAKMNIYGLN
jgi:hypothetical protein